MDSAQSSAIDLQRNDNSWRITRHQETSMLLRLGIIGQKLSSNGHGDLRCAKPRIAATKSLTRNTRNAKPIPVQERKFISSRISAAKSSARQRATTASGTIS
jgi:hypothetical protein